MGQYKTSTKDNVDLSLHVSIYPLEIKVDLPIYSSTLPFYLPACLIIEIKLGLSVYLS